MSPSTSTTTPPKAPTVYKRCAMCRRYFRAQLDGDYCCPACREAEKNRGGAGAANPPNPDEDRHAA